MTHLEGSTSSVYLDFGLLDIFPRNMDTFFTFSKNVQEIYFAGY